MKFLAKTKDKSQKIKDKLAPSSLVKSKLNADTVHVLKKNWTFLGMFVATLVCFALSLLVICYLALRPKTEIGYVVEVNPLTGEQKTIRNAVKEMSSFTAPEYLFLNGIKSYIVNLRSVSSDDGVNRENKKKVYAFSTEMATSFVNEYYKENDPVKLNNDKRVRKDVVIYNCMPINTAQGLKFQVDWNEITRDSSGRFVSEQNWRADVDCKQYKATKQTSDLNPLGLYVANIGISEITNGFIKQQVKEDK